jgi:hypothetical protein
MRPYGASQVGDAVSRLLSDANRAGQLADRAFQSFLAGLFGDE